VKTHYGKLKGKHTQTKGDEDMKIMMIESKTRKSAMKRAPWAAKVVKVSGGWLAFESITDYTVWKKQK